MEKIMDAIECILAFLRKIPLSNSSIKQYKIYLHRLKNVKEDW
jgi:hypothetical protein